MFKKAFFLFFMLPSLLLAQHTISGTFSPADKFKFAILYKKTPVENLYSKDVAVDSLGNIKFSIDKTAGSEIYTLVYAIPQEVNNFEIIYNGTEDIAFTFDYEKGVLFTKSDENILYQKYTAEMVGLNTQIYQAMLKEKSPKDFSKLFETQSEIQEKYEKLSEGLVCSKFIKASAPFIPTNFTTAEKYNQQVEKHYFDNIDVTDKTLQKSSFMMDKLLMYIRNEVDIDRVITQLETTSLEYKLSLEQLLWQELSASQNLSNYLATTYLIPLLKENGKTDKAEIVQKVIDISLGNKAPNFSWEEVVNGQAKQTSLYDQSGSEKYVVIFWSSTCSHCLKEMPVLNEQLAKIKKSKLSAIAYGLEDSEFSWKKEIPLLPNFTHVLGLGHWDNYLVKKYNVHSTPTFFLLNSEKQIIAKPNTLDELLALINNNSK